MIKEKKKNTKYNTQKKKSKIILEYIKTILCSFFVALVITTCLAIHAKNEMLKDIIRIEQEQKLLDKKMALEIISQTNLLKDLNNKKYSVCMHAGEIYETAGDYIDAQRAYELAVSKTKPNNYRPYYKLIEVLVAQNNFKDANAILDNIKDINNLNLIKFKTKSYLAIGDRYFSISKFLSAAKSYEKSKFYYDKLAKKDENISRIINQRTINSYIKTADIMVKAGLNSDAIRFLKKAEKYSPKDFNIRYKLAIVYADLDPEKSVEYFEQLLEERPQDIDFGVFNRALMKSANIADLDNRHAQAKYYRYKIHSIDLFLSRKVVYKNDFDIELNAVDIKKVFFKYPLNISYNFINSSSSDLFNLSADFVLCNKDKNLETLSTEVANKKRPMYSYSYEPNIVNIKFKKNIYTQKELENYTVKVYLYKDPKYKTLVYENKIIP